MLGFLTQPARLSAHIDLALTPITKRTASPMTVDSRPEHAALPADGPSIHVIRARKLLLGGAIGGLAATVICLVGFTIGYGSSGLVSAALAAAMVLFFYGLGQYVMVLFADAGARTLLTVSCAAIPPEWSSSVWCWCSTTGTRKVGRP